MDSDTDSRYYLGYVVKMAADHVWIRQRNDTNRPVYASLDRFTGGLQRKQRQKSSTPSSSKKAVAGGDLRTFPGAQLLGPVKFSLLDDFDCLVARHGLDDGKVGVCEQVAKDWQFLADSPDFSELFDLDSMKLKKCRGLLVSMSGHTGQLWAGGDINFVFMSQAQLKWIDPAKNLTNFLKPSDWLQFDARVQPEKNGCCWQAENVKRLSSRPHIPIQVEYDRNEHSHYVQSVDAVIGCVFENEGLAFAWNEFLGRISLKQPAIAAVGQLRPLQPVNLTVTLNTVSNAKWHSCWTAVAVRRLHKNSNSKQPLVVVETEIEELARSTGILKHPNFGRIFFNFNDWHRRSPHKDLSLEIFRENDLITAAIVPQMANRGCAWRALYMFRAKSNSPTDPSSSNRFLPSTSRNSEQRDYAAGTRKYSIVDRKEVSTQTERSVHERVYGAVMKDMEMFQILAKKRPELVKFVWDGYNCVRPEANCVEQRQRLPTRCCRR